MSDNAAREKFEEDRHILRLRQSLRGTWDQVERLWGNGQYAEAIETLEDQLPVVERLGEQLPLIDYPVCIACVPRGTGERPSAPGEQRMTQCVSDPLGCRGNQHGRMHPYALLEFLARERHLATPYATQGSFEYVTPTRGHGSRSGAPLGLPAIRETEASSTSEETPPAPSEERP